jgi:hypothetical protein
VSFLADSNPAGSRPEDRSADMLSDPQAHVNTPAGAFPPALPAPPPRWELKHDLSITGYVDGAWWPRSRNLSAELSALLAVLPIKLGQPERVAYDLTAWDVAPRRLNINGFNVGLDGFHHQQPDTVDVRTRKRHIALLIVPPESAPADARQTLLRASQAGNSDSIKELLSPRTSLTGTSPGDSADAAMERWEANGGSTYKHNRPHHESHSGAQRLHNR